MAVERQILEERIALPVTPALSAGLHRFTPQSGDVRGTVMMLHGLMQDSSVFFDPLRGGGLAYYLAELGYDVFVCSLRGRDASPDLLKQGSFGMQQVLKEDMALIWRAVDKRCRHPDRYLVGYQFGGVLWSAFLARCPELLDAVRGIIHFCPQRMIAPGGRRKRFWYGFLEAGVLPTLGKILGYIPSQRFSVNKQNESLPFYTDAIRWRNDKWQDPWDGFDYQSVMADLQFPPSLYFVTLRQPWQEFADDCRSYMFELGDHNARMIKLGSGAGNLADYRRHELCTDLNAEKDYFPYLIRWMAEVAKPDNNVAVG